MDAKLPASRDFEVIRHTQNFAEGIRLPVERVERMGSARIHRCGAEKGDPRHRTYLFKILMADDRLMMVLAKKTVTLTIK